MKKKLKGLLTTAIATALWFSNGLPFFTSQVQAAETAKNPPTLPTLPVVQTLSHDVTAIDGEYIVSFKEGTPVRTMKAVIEQYGGKTIDGNYESNLISIKLTNNQYEQIKKDKHIEVIEENQSVHLLDYGPLSQYSHEKTNVAKAWESNLKGKGIKIAVLDSGISTHSDLTIAGGVSTVDYTNSYDDDNGHGTHVAGIIASKDNDVGTTGVASEANLYSVKVQGFTGKGDLMDFIEGVDWAIKNDMDLINMSMGTDRHSAALKAKIDEAVSKGIIVVAAAGNTGDFRIMYPANYENVIAVGATDEDNHLASFSTRGPAINIVAPGVKIVSTYLGDIYAIGNGTSQATPYVTGMLALFMEKYPGKSAREMTQMLYDHALDLGERGKDPLYGYGLVQYPIYEQEESTKEIKEDQKPAEQEEPKEEEDQETVEGETKEKGPKEQTELQKFPDVNPNYWAFDEITYLTQREIIFGYRNGKFGPNDSINRLQAILMILRQKGITQFSNVENPGFTDVKPGDDGYETIAKSVELGITHGKVNKKGQPYFDPYGKLTRAEMAKILANAYVLKSHNQTTFKDVPKNYWAYESIQALADNGITIGDGNGKCKPHKYMTRAQFSVMMARLLEESFRELPA